MFFQTEMLAKRTLITLTLVSCLLLLSVGFSFAEIRVFFSPKGGIAEEVITQIDGAEDHIDIAIYSFTSKPIAEAIVRAKKRGVRVRVVFDKRQSQIKDSKYAYLEQNGIMVAQDTHAGIMHNKVAIIDGRILFTGSYNWSRSAEEKNRENVVEFIDEEEIIRVYQARLNQFWPPDVSFAPPRKGGLDIQIILVAVQVATLIALIVYVVKTWHMASATKKMAEASKGTLREMKESRDLLVRPYVTVYFDSPPGRAWINLVIENTGSGPARDVDLKFNPALRNSRRNLMDLEVFEKGISLLPPGQKLKMFFDVGFHYFDKDLPMRYEVEVTYRGGLEDTLRQEKYTLDLSVYKGLPTIGRKEMHELVEVMERMEKILNELKKSK